MSRLPRFGRLRHAAPNRFWRRLVQIAVMIFAFWVAGLLWFAREIPHPGPLPDRRTDAIVVLTGGTDRLETGFALLAAKGAKKLFVSGVYHGVDVAALLHMSRQRPEDVACCVAIGYAADNTQGNANETATWMKKEGFRSLTLVTASYHMPRSLLEFRRRMPDIEIVPHPVFPERFKHDNWWMWPGTASLMASEYTKYLLAVVRGIVAPDAAPATGPEQGP